MHSSLLVSNNYYLRIALHSLAKIDCTDTDSFIRDSTRFINVRYSVILLDFTCITGFATAADILHIIRKYSPETSVCVIRSSATHLRYLTVNPNVLVTDPVYLILRKIKDARFYPSSLRHPPRRFTRQECRFLFLYLQNHNMHYIASRLNIERKTAYAVKNNIWKKTEIRRDIDIVLFRRTIERYLFDTYPLFI